MSDSRFVLIIWTSLARGFWGYGLYLQRNGLHQEPSGIGLRNRDYRDFQVINFVNIARCSPSLRAVTEAKSSMKSWYKIAAGSPLLLHLSASFDIDGKRLS
jgi:hypothetical protein